MSTAPISLMLVLLAGIAIFSGAEARVCRGTQHSWSSMIGALGGSQAGQLQNIYRREGLNCYVGDHGSSFGPFQFHYGGGMGDLFTRLTGLNASNPSTVPAQITFMRHWGVSHGGFSSSIWHGLRGRHNSGRHWHHRRHRTGWR